MRKCFILIAFCCFLFSTAFCWADTYYVRMDGSDSTCDGSQNEAAGDGSCAWRSVSFALKQITGTHTVSIENGTYREPQLSIPPGVSITSTHANADLVTITPSQNYRVGRPYIRFYSPSPGTQGNQSITHVTIDGDNGSNAARQGIEVLNRNNVEIAHNTITNFKGAAGWSQSYGIRAHSSQTTASSENYTYGLNTDVSMNSEYPKNPLEGFSLHHNQITKCGDGTPDRTFTGAISAYHLKDSTINDNTIDTRHAYTEGIFATPAFWNNVSVYNNTFIAHSRGSFPQSHDNDGNIIEKDQSLYVFEVWILHNCTIRNNRSNSAWSIAYGKNNNLHSNLIDTSKSSSPRGYGIEYTAMNDSYINFNRIISRPDKGTSMGMHLGLTIYQDNKAYETTTYAYGNIIHGTRWHGIDATCTNDGRFDTSATIFFHNNIVDGNAGSDKVSFSGVYLAQSGNGTFHFSAKNNIITNNQSLDVDRQSYGINLHEGTLATEDISHNAILGQTHNTRNVQNLNPISDMPTFTDYNGDDFTMTSGSGIDSGVDLADLYKTAIGTSTRWDQNPLVVNTINRNDNAPWDLGPYEYGDDGNPVDPVDPDRSAEGIIIDNQDPEFTQSATGWSGDTLREDSHGGSHDYDATSGADSADVWARWSPDIETAGEYAVYMWTFAGGHPTAAPLTVAHANGSTDTTVNQVGNGGWIYIGTYTFNSGSDGYVQITAEDSGHTIADAVKFVRPTVPGAPIDLTID